VSFIIRARTIDPSFVSKEQSFAQHFGLKMESLVSLDMVLRLDKSVSVGSCVCLAT